MRPDRDRLKRCGWRSRISAEKSQASPSRWSMPIIRTRRMSAQPSHVASMSRKMSTSSSILPNSAVAFAVLELSKQKNKAMLVSSAGSSDLTGKACSPNSVQWTYNTYALANSTARALVKEGAKSWYFVTVDYAFGHALRNDAAKTVEKLGGTVEGEVCHPFNRVISHPICFRPRARMPTSWRSPIPAGISPVRSGRPGIRAGEQAEARGVPDANERIHVIGLFAAKGLQLTTAYYWALTTRPRFCGALDGQDQEAADDGSGWNSIWR